MPGHEPAVRSQLGRLRAPAGRGRRAAGPGWRRRRRGLPGCTQDGAGRGRREARGAGAVEGLFSTQALQPAYSTPRSPAATPLDGASKGVCPHLGLEAPWQRLPRLHLLRLRVEKTGGHRRSQRGRRRMPASRRPLKHSWPAPARTHACAHSPCTTAMLPVSTRKQWLGATSGRLRECERWRQAEGWAPGLAVSCARHRCPQCRPAQRVCGE